MRFPAGGLRNGDATARRAVDAQPHKWATSTYHGRPTTDRKRRHGAPNRHTSTPTTRRIDWRTIRCLFLGPTPAEDLRANRRTARDRKASISYTGIRRRSAVPRIPTEGDRARAERVVPMRWRQKDRPPLAEVASRNHAVPRRTVSPVRVSPHPDSKPRATCQSPCKPAHPQPAKDALRTRSVPLRCPRHSVYHGRSFPSPEPKSARANSAGPTDRTSRRGSSRCRYAPPGRNVRRDSHTPPSPPPAERAQYEAAIGHPSEPTHRVRSRRTPRKKGRERPPGSDRSHRRPPRSGALPEYERTGRRRTPHPLNRQTGHSIRCTPQHRLVMNEGRTERTSGGVPGLREVKQPPGPASGHGCRGRYSGKHASVQRLHEWGRQQVIAP